MTNKITCFLPCRAGSQRVPKKNIKHFAGHEYGLIEIKLRQLINTQNIDEIVLTTNDLEILDYADSLREPRLRLHRRIEDLCSSTTSTDQLVAHAHELISQGSILWTHVTSPFITAKCYDKIINSYFEQVKQGCDSLMTTTRIQGFLWSDGQPINYDRNSEKWPRTQSLKPIQEINSGVFLASVDTYVELNDRIGRHPFMYELDKLTGFDIDWHEDFMVAECLLEKGLVTV